MFQLLVYVDNIFKYFSDSYWFTYNRYALNGMLRSLGCDGWYEGGRDAELLKAGCSYI